LNGTISVRSEINSGSIFKIELLDIEIIDEIDHLKHHSKSSRRNVHFEPASILVVDDIEFNRILIREYIANSGLMYFEAQDSSEALHIMNEMNFDIILMDLKLPDIDGLTLTNMIRSTEKFKPCPIIAFTASAIKFDLIEYDGMFDGYLVKPLKYEDLIIELTKHLKIIYNNDLVENSEDFTEVNNDSDCDPIILNSIINSLESELLPGIDYLSQYLILGEIENLVVKLKNINEFAKISHLTKYANELNLSLKRYDVKNIKVSLSNFNKLIETLKDLNNSNHQNL
jgi:CheY-like chemotaxis protein